MVQVPQQIPMIANVLEQGVFSLGTCGEAHTHPDRCILECLENSLYHINFTSMVILR